MTVVVIGDLTRLSEAHLSNKLSHPVANCRAEWSSRVTEVVPHRGCSVMSLYLIQSERT